MGNVVEMPEGFPIAPIDARGESLNVGDSVKVLTVESCARGLPQTDQARLRSIVGAYRTIIEFDAYGFVWLSFAESDPGTDFSLFPNEVAREHDA